MQEVQSDSKVCGQWDTLELHRGPTSQQWEVAQPCLSHLQGLWNEGAKGMFDLEQLVTAHLQQAGQGVFEY